MFLLFAGCEYYPAGGAGDFQGAFATVEEARAAFQHGTPVPGMEPYRFDWADIETFDGAKFTAVARFHSGRDGKPRWRDA